ncbi:MAG: hypothetical protein RLZZ165_1421 [Bacteroidota bacterium]|jgi:hypothetical protein
MIIYSVTITVDNAVEADWVAWMRTKHIPDVLETGYFQGAHLHRLLDPAPEAGSSTFNVQYQCESLQLYEQYRDMEAPRLQQEHLSRYKDRFVAFRTILRREDSF